MIRSMEAQHQKFLNILTEVMKANNSKNLTRNQILTFLDHPVQFKMKTNDSALRAAHLMKREIQAKLVFKYKNLR